MAKLIARRVGPRREGRASKKGKEINSQQKLVITGGRNGQKPLIESLDDPGKRITTSRRSSPSCRRRTFQRAPVKTSSSAPDQHHDHRRRRVVQRVAPTASRHFGRENGDCRRGHTGQVLGMTRCSTRNPNPVEEGIGGDRKIEDREIFQKGLKDKKRRRRSVPK